MLKGYFKKEGYTYPLRGYDFGDNIALYLSSPVVKAKFLVDEGIVEDEYNTLPPTWEDFYISIGIGSVKTDCYMEIIDGEKRKNRVNTEFVCRLASIIRGMKSGCNSLNLDRGNELFDTGFNPMKITTHLYPEGYIKLDLGVIRELKYTGDIDNTELYLEEDGSYEEKIWSLTKIHHRFKLDLSEFVKTVEEEDVWEFEEPKIFSLQEIIERNPDKSYVWLKDRRYEIVNTIPRLEQVCKMIWNHKGVVAFDTETTGLKVNIKSREGKGDRLVGMVFSIKPGEAFYFPVKHKKIQNFCSDENEYFLIEKYFKPILEKKELVCHNGAYDWKVMYNYGICINLVHDTYILFKVSLWNDHTNLELGLKSLVKRFLGRDSFELKDFVVGKFDSNLVKFWDLDEKSTKFYACPDTDSLLELFNFAMEEDFLGKYDARKIYEIEVQFSIVIAYQEYYGHCVNIDKIDDLVAAIQKDKEETYAKMVERVGFEFNPKSNKDMPKVCFDVLKLPVVGLTDAGNPSTGKDTRKTWLKSSEVSDENKEFVRNLNTYLDARTLESNFTKNIDKFATSDGLMFSEVQQFLATGRVSTNEPNYQGYSDTVKKYIVPRDGYYGFDSDYSSVEARIMCSMAGCKNMVEKLKDPDTDYHRQKASDMFGVPYELVTDALRKMSKGVNFGILYGLGDPNLGVNLYGTKSPENTRKAKQAKRLYFKGMEELETFIDISKAQGRNNHFSTTYFKRRRYFDTRTTRVDAIERQSCNARIQGTAADIYKIAMVRLFTEIKNRDWLGKVLISAFVHDECFLEVHKSIDPFVLLKVLRKSMMLEIEGWCPLFIGAGYGETWYEAKHTEIPVQVQESLVETYGETGIDWWKGNTRELCDWVISQIAEYKKIRVLNYLKDEKNWGGVFAPTESELCNSLLESIKEGQEVDGAISTECTISNDMLENLKEFCRIFDCLDLYEKANIRKPEHKESTLGTITDNTAEDSLQEDMYAKDTLKMRVNMLGVVQKKSKGSPAIYFKYEENNKVLMNLLHDTMMKNPGDIKVFAIKEDDIFSTGINVSCTVYPKLLQLYMSYKNLNSSRR